MSGGDPDPGTSQQKAARKRGKDARSAGGVVDPAPCEAQRYPRLDTSLPPNLHARLQAASVVLAEPAQEVLERALERELARLSVEQRELLDRVAASLISRSEIE